ncbi:hypothetical protein CR513_45234, partial [Mucuna pruriens]
MQLEIESVEFSNSFEDIDVINYLGSIVDEFDHDELLEVQDLFDSEDGIIDLANLDLNSEIIDLIDCVCKNDEEPKCSKRAKVQVVETEKSLQAQVATIITTEFESANQGRDQTWPESNSDNKRDTKSDLSILPRAESNSDSKNRKLVTSKSNSSVELTVEFESSNHLGVEIDSKIQVRNPDRVGQLKPGLAIDISLLHLPPIELKPLPGREISTSLKVAQEGNRMAIVRPSRSKSLNLYT